MRNNKGRGSGLSLIMILIVVLIVAWLVVKNTGSLGLGGDDDAGGTEIEQMQDSGESGTEASNPNTNAGAGAGGTQSEQGEEIQIDDPVGAAQDAVDAINQAQQDAAQEP